MLRELAWKEGVAIKSTQKTRRMSRKEEKLQASSSLEPKRPCATGLYHGVGALTSPGRPHSTPSHPSIQASTPFAHPEIEADHTTSSSDLDTSPHHHGHELCG